jgi:hypothetical protein
LSPKQNCVFPQFEHGQGSAASEQGEVDAMTDFSQRTVGTHKSKKARTEASHSYVAKCLDFAKGCTTLEYLQFKERLQNSLNLIITTAESKTSAKSRVETLTKELPSQAQQKLDTQTKVLLSDFDSVIARARSFVASMEEVPKNPEKMAEAQKHTDAIQHEFDDAQTKLLSQEVALNYLKGKKITSERHETMNNRYAKNKVVVNIYE